ncbi:MAG: PorT family protein [Alistipes sp.]|jgi:hypothetical protein|nr:PorT family protein [Alistipes sp.]
MKKLFLIALAAVLTMGAAGVQQAQAQKFQLGVRAGLASQSMGTDVHDMISGKAKLGYHLAAVSRIRLIGIGSGILGAGLFLQPEVVYSQSSVKADFGYFTNITQRVGVGPSASYMLEKIRMKTIDVPLLLGLQASILRIQAGPVFNLMNNFDTVDGNMEFLPLRPAVGYAVGASVDLMGLTIDGRYHGDFKKMSFSGGWGDVKSRFSSWSLGVGLMF